MLTKYLYTIQEFFCIKKLPPVPRTFKRSKSFMVTCRDLVGDGSIGGTTTFAAAVSQRTLELVI